MPINIPGSIPTSIASGIPGGGSDFAFLLSDNFVGDGAVNGRIPQIGSAWGVSGIDAANLATLGGEMYQNAGVAAAYATSATAALIGEVGCNFRVTAITNAVILGGSATAGAFIGANIYPSGSTSFVQPTYTLSGGDTLDTAATAWAAVITANATMIANGITANAVGTTVFIVATQSPRVDAFGVGTVTTTASTGAIPVLATYVTGSDFTQNMLHFRLGPDGYCDWTIFDGGVITLFNTFTGKRIGLTANTTYTYRCCISPPYVWGGVYSGATLQGCAWGQDSRISSKTGGTCFFETFGANVLFYGDAWAYNTPSVSLAVIQAAAA